MSESGDPIQIATIKGSMVSEDGRFVILRCQARDGGERELMIPTPALRNVVTNLQMLATSALGVMETSDPVEVPTVNFGQPEPVFFVTALGGTVFSETGQVHLRIGQLNGPTFQIQMRREHSRILYNLLLDLFAIDDETPS